MAADSAEIRKGKGWGLAGAGGKSNGRSPRVYAEASASWMRLTCNALNGIRNCCSEQQACVIMKPIKGKSGAH